MRLDHLLSKEHHPAKAGIGARDLRMSGRGAQMAETLASFSSATAGIVLVQLLFGVVGTGCLVRLGEGGEHPVGS